METVVIIPVRDQLLEAFGAIQSVHRQCYRVIVVLDGHNNPAMQRAMQNTGPNVLCVSTDTQVGPSAARNQAIGLAPDDSLIIPLDADDRMEPQGVSCLSAQWQPDRWTYSNWLVQNNISNRQSIGQANQPEIFAYKPLCYATMCYSKRQWKQVGGYDIDFNIGAEDWALQIALTNAGYEPHWIDATCYTRSVSQNRGTNKAYDNRYAIHKLMQSKFPGVYIGSI